MFSHWVSSVSSAVPWRQIHAILMARITSGEYPPGGRLPSIVTMAQEFDVALTTARKALDVLKEDGLVVTSPMGTFVIPPGERNPRPPGDGGS